MYEKKHHQLATKKIFIKRILQSTIVASVILMLWLIAGIVGYKITCHFDWYDSLLNASMIMSGMGPTNTIETNIGKVFASIYAIISGVLFIMSIGIFLTPVVHRLMHKFHLETE